MQRTDDDGESWRVANTGVVGQTLQLAADPTDGDVFFLEAGGHLWKTNDGAAHWSLSDTGLPYGASAVAIDPSSPSTAHRRGPDHTARRTAGRPGAAGRRFPRPVAHPGALPSTPRTGTASTRRRTPASSAASTDQGATVDRRHSEYITDLLVAQDGDVFVGTDYTVRRWGPTSSDPTLVSTLPDLFQAFGEDPGDADRIYAGTMHGVYQSIDGGRWTQLTTVGLDSDFITDISRPSLRATAWSPRRAGRRGST